ncbi:IscS subfamily cysteine desulfurase [Bacillus marasmi]|uniref:IscS subfamily cysteine desulfurase n=1 Tax=Bacillus marasmi TaxID=1926279 RepID=UPI0011CB8D96|nr:IscS subfamily cysteine desulfurase [Bacillus marasmi]
MKYLDYAATGPLDEEAANIFVKIATQYYGNSNSLHDIGEEARTLLENCRNEFSQMLSVEKEGVYFTSGGSESNFLAIEALLTVKIKPGCHIITSLAEHSSVHNHLDRLCEQGYRVTKLPFNSSGIIDINLFQQSIEEDTVLAIFQHGNSEIGTIQPIAEIGRICKTKNILLHCDCVQTFGKLDVSKITPYLDSLSISGHKFYGPKGIGVAYIRPQLNIIPFFKNTTHEKGFRPGTINVPAITAMTVAAKKAINTLDQNQQRSDALRASFITSLQPIKDHITIFGGPPHHQLPNIIGMSLDGIEGQWVLLECNRNGFAISTGSACHTGLLTPAQAMIALNITGKRAKEYFRISFGKDTTHDDMQTLAQLIINIFKQHKSLY